MPRIRSGQILSTRHLESSRGSRLQNPQVLEEERLTVFKAVPNGSQRFPTVPNGSKWFRFVPFASARFRTLPHGSARLRLVPGRRPAGAQLARSPLAAKWVSFGPAEN